MSSIGDRAKGRWPEILTSEFGVDPAVLSGKHQPCPACGGTDRFRFNKQKEDDGVFFCGDTVGSGMDLVMHLSGLSFREAAERVETVVGRDNEWKPREKSLAESTLEKAAPLKASQYLLNRGVRALPRGLFGIRGLAYFEDGKVVGKYDAILAPLHRDGKLVTVQATYLQGGQKAPVRVSKKTLPGGYETINGAAVQLGGWAEGQTLGFAEGVETAISAAILNGHPVWATLSTAGMKSVKWPKGLVRARIYADNDASLAGHAAAWHLAHRLVVGGVTDVTVVFPDEVGEDWNDVLRKEVEHDTP